MKANWKDSSLAALLLTLTLSGLTEAGSIGPGDFVNPTTVTYDGLGLPFANTTPKVIAGDTYTTDDGILRFFDGGVPGCTNDCIGNNTDLGFLDVVLGEPVLRVGAFFGTSHFPWAADVSFFNAANSLLGTISLSGNPSQFEFAGWEDVGGISRIRAVDTSSNLRVLVMDTLMKESQTGFLRLPLDLTSSDCGNVARAPETVRISAVLDHSGLFNCNQAGTCDGIVLAFNGEKGLKGNGENCPPPGYKNAIIGTDFFSGVINYVGASCSRRYGKEAFNFPRHYLNYDGHSGYDFPFDGKTILAAADGILEVPVADPINNPRGSSPHATFNTLRLIHPNGLETWYLHAVEGSECLAFRGSMCKKHDPQRPLPGEQVLVTAGAAIAISGSTGVSSPHLHFEVRSGLAQVVDPFGCVPAVAEVNPPLCRGRLWIDD